MDCKMSGGILCVSLLLILVIIKQGMVLANVEIRADCGQPVDIGEPQLLTCSIQGMLSSGINWKKGRDDVITCYLDGGCDQPNLNLYKLIAEKHASDSQQFIIKNVSDDDFNRQWTCSDGMNPNVPASSSCRLKRKTGAITSTNCGNGAMVGYSAVVTCNIWGQVKSSVRMYRGFDLVAKCNKDEPCVAIDDRYWVFSSKVTENLQVIIKKVEEEDFSYKYRCSDSLAIPIHQSDSSTCRMIRTYPSHTEARCGVADYKSIIVTCEVKDKLINGVTIFRGVHSVLRCSPSYKCFAEDPSRYGYLINGTIIRLVVANILPDDYNQAWSCIDSSELPLVVPAKSSCYMQRATTVAPSTTHRLETKVSATIGEINGSATIGSVRESRSSGCIINGNVILCTYLYMILMLLI